ncbi:subtilase-type protease inhibitor [Streptomyces sp. NBC_01224]|uniref:SSI family serine proteinase inhibitor n=1 Tax=unclassified Streptomyces TaxID=2593676 RepID=UPI002E139CE8|nr:subtilase-type protease inhibitor [Streptomyces sp. NBC_01224]
MLRRLALTVVVSLAALSAAAPGATAATAPLPLPLPLLHADDARTRLMVTVSGTGDPAAEGVFELKCGPAGGSHPAAQQACDRLDELAAEGADPFAPVPGDAMCTQQFGGPATARVTGTWRGRSIDTAFERTNGCAISRWNGLRPVLPNVR